ncbi:peptidoglycan amidohydrolase family protein [Enterococcus termitis]|uniref:peptidoglycan amidohydrolase family protein n=1 Tax=Enterococcus termitis TaxID=332950 RepID=UPI0009175DF0|nr:phage lysin, N-acetylmuramoyl-L-alanineamidase [Enterococcus termitis]
MCYQKGEVVTNINAMIDWMQQRQGKVIYSMAARLGLNSYDYSSAVYSAIITSGF